MNSNMLQQRDGFTLLELIIVMGIIALIILSYPLTFNLKTQVGRSQDTRRKTDLDGLKRILEEYYNDNGHYPPPAEICYNDTGNTTCDICGKQDTPAAMQGYMEQLPCDPEFASKSYLYHVDNAASPLWYRVYAKFSNRTDAAVQEQGCVNGCGVGPYYDYSYGISSPNIDIERNTIYCNSYTNLYVLQNGLCNNCGTLANCIRLYGDTTSFYTDAGGGGVQGCTIDCVK